jgi:hypothetical protein
MDIVSSYIHDFFAPNIVGSTTSSQIERVDYPYHYNYTNISREELRSITSLATSFNNGDLVSPEGINAVVMAIARQTSRNIRSILVTDDEVAREESQQRRRTRRRTIQRRATALLRSNRRHSSSANVARLRARSHRQTGRNTRILNSNLDTTLRRSWRRSRIDNHGSL